MALGRAGALPATWKEPVGSGDNHISGWGRDWASRSEGTHQRLEGQPDTLREGVGKLGLFIIKSVKKIEWLKFRAWPGMRREQREPQRRCFLKPQEKIMQGNRKWDSAFSKAQSYRCRQFVTRVADGRDYLHT